MTDRLLGTGYSHSLTYPTAHDYEGKRTVERSSRRDLNQLEFSVSNNEMKRQEAAEMMTQKEHLPKLLICKYSCK